MTMETKESTKSPEITRTQRIRDMAFLRILFPIVQVYVFFVGTDLVRLSKRNGVMAFLEFI